MNKIALTFAVLFLGLTMNKAFANQIDYTLTSGTDTITFSLAQNVSTPAPCSRNNSNCFGDPTPVTIDGTLYPNATVDFFTPANGGGLEITDLPNLPNTLFVNQSGLQLFTGTSTNPGTLLTFTNLQLTAAVGSTIPVYNESFVLNATLSTPSVIPEPSTFLLLSSGLAGLAGMIRRKMLV